MRTHREHAFHNFSEACLHLQLNVSFVCIHVCLQMLRKLAEMPRPHVPGHNCRSKYV